jgi:twitching motility two-component system response regulator PilH
LARKILLADDSVTAQNMGRKILADAGYEVITVNNGSAALKRIAEAKPDLIVLDVYMPGYSGLEVCQRLKDSNDTARIPILLTVGKLEPFKPEEAKRVRAEAFIVKPFEASELLSAVTKLEDKIVPRADSSKPGRFARAIAAVEEGRYDKTVAIDEDSGWKNRISFPKKKKEKSPDPENGDEPALYNPVNRDLKTVVEPKPPQEPVHTPVPPAVQPAGQPGQAHVDLGALVAHGLPKDVTPEEIAALAAAAAQVQGISEGRSFESASPAAQNAPEIHGEESSKPEEASSSPEAVRSDESKFEPVLEKPANQQTREAAEVPIVAVSETKPEESAKVDAGEAVVEPAATSDKTSQEVPATFASENLQPKEEAEPEPKSAAIAREEAISAAVDRPLAIASFATADVAATSADDGSVYAMPLAAQGEVPAAIAAVQAVPSRWTAVAVALAPEEASIALEEEMRRAQLTAVAALMPQSAAASVEAQAIDQPPVIADMASVPETPAVEAEAVAQATPMSAAPEVAAEEPAVAERSAIPAVKEFETVTPRAPETPPSVAEAAVELSAPPASIITESAETPVAVPAITESATDTKLAESASESVIESALEPVSSVTVNESAASEEFTPVHSEVVSPAAQEIPDDTQPPETVKSAESSFEQAPDSHISQESGEPAAAVAMEGISGGFSGMGKKESDIAASTAAAWASWRRIRQSDDKGAEKQSEPGSSRDEAAMAVAAGAEKAPEEVSDEAEASPEIANIVDSVLADLRPKIVEEISKKLGKKK